MTRRPLLHAVLLAMLCLPLALHADPLHPLGDGAHWHHESNFIFPATLAGFDRIGVPQEVDGSTTIGAHYGNGSSDRRLVVDIELFPAETGAADLAGAMTIDTIDLGPGRGTARRALFQATPGEVVYAIDHGGWRMRVRGRLLEDTDAARIDALVRALPIERLGEFDVRCPNPGCGS